MKKGTKSVIALRLCPSPLRNTGFKRESPIINGSPPLCPVLLIDRTYKAEQQDNDSRMLEAIKICKILSAYRMLENL